MERKSGSIRVPPMGKVKNRLTARVIVTSYAGSVDTVWRDVLAELGFEWIGEPDDLAERSPGSYALIIPVATPTEIAVGALGRIRFAAGVYAYCGSALGPGGLRARLIRHCRVAKRCHWHVDYLLAETRIGEVWVAHSDCRLECTLAAALRRLGAVPVPRFGSSDCRCSSHLLRLPSSDRSSLA